MKTIRFLPTSLLFYAALVHAVSVDFPNTIRENSDVVINWKGQQPFDFAVFAVDPSTNGNTLLTQLIGTQETTFTWTSVNAGTTVFFFVSDETSQFAQSPNILIQAAAEPPTQTTTTSSSTTSSTHTTSSSSTAGRTSTPSPTPTPPSDPQPPVYTPPASATGTSTQATTASTSPTVAPNTPAPPLPSPSTTSSSSSPTASSNPAVATQESLSKDRSIPYIIGIVAGLLGLILILIIVRYLVKWRRRRMENAAASDGGHPFSNNWRLGKSPGMSSFGFTGDLKDGSAFSAYNDLEKDGNGSGSMLPLHAMPYGHAYTESRSGSSPMLPPPSSQSRSITNPSGRLANARASSVMLPIDDNATINPTNEWGEEEEDGDFRAMITAMARTPSVGHGHQRNQNQAAERSLAAQQEQQRTPLPSSSAYHTQPQPPSSWKIIVPPVVPEFGHKLPVLESGNGSPNSSTASRATLAAQYNLPHPSVPLPAAAPSPTTSYTRERRPSSPSPFDDVVFDLGTLSRVGTTKTASGSGATKADSGAAEKAKKSRDAVRRSGERAIWPVNVDDQDEEVQLKHPSLNFLLTSPPLAPSSTPMQQQPARVSRIPSPTMAFGDATPTASEMMTAMSVGSDSEGAFVKRMLAGISESSPSSSPSSSPEPLLGSDVLARSSASPRAPSVLSQHSSSASSTLHSQGHSPPRRRPQQGNWV